jgi:hypothetical protein
MVGTARDGNVEIANLNIVKDNYQNGKNFLQGPESVTKSSTIPLQPIEITGNMLHNPLSSISPGG